MSHWLQNTSNYRQGGFKEVFIVGETNNLPARGAIFYHNASAKMFQPEQSTPSASMVCIGPLGACQK